MSDQTTTKTRTRTITGLPYEEQVVAQFRADIDGLLSEFPTAGLAEMHKHLLERRPTCNIGSGLFRKLMKKAGFEASRAKTTIRRVG